MSAKKRAVLHFLVVLNCMRMLFLYLCNVGGPV